MSTSVITDTCEVSISDTCHTEVHSGPPLWPTEKKTGPPLTTPKISGPPTNRQHPSR